MAKRQPPIKDRKSVLISVSDKTLKQLDKVAKKENMSRTNIIVTAISLYLEAYNEATPNHS